MQKWTPRNEHPRNTDYRFRSKKIYGLWLGSFFRLKYLVEKFEKLCIIYSVMVPIILDLWFAAYKWLAQLINLMTKLNILSSFIFVLSSLFWQEAIILKMIMVFYSLTFLLFKTIKSSGNIIPFSCVFMILIFLPNSLNFISSFNHLIIFKIFNHHLLLNKNLIYVKNIAWKLSKVSTETIVKHFRSW